MVNEEMTRKEILENHPYSIYYCETDKRWHTYVYDTTKKKNRRLIVRKEKQDIENYIVEYYKKKETITFEKTYPKFIEYQKTRRSTATITDYVKTYKKFCKDEKNITQKALDKITSIELGDWFNYNIKKYNLTYKAFMKLYCLFSQLYAYCNKFDYFTENPFDGIDTKEFVFKSKTKKPEEAEVFLVDEAPAIQKMALADFNSKPYAVPLGVAFAFQIGMRIGEVCTLKWSDINNRSIIVQRMERSYQETIEEGRNLGSCKLEVIDSTKGQFGQREVILTDQALKILEMARKHNEMNGYDKCADGEYIFVNSRGRIHHRGLDLRIRKYCRQLGICDKSFHKIRRTYISTLIDNKVNLRTVANQVGHQKTSTTLNNYCYNRFGRTETEEAINRALCS